ncbi:dihydrofolate reductase [Saccharata proteae CBS 121410]|uniref:Dihydrofolate reductase n=1 Tax=Saccharata proteae CBS 121410 TaxID=1314787 RepID=A0A9P4LXZ9_9PEZI|nr:dihydrofolate reductase [Saccharata proteae CBS 121410]
MSSTRLPLTLIVAATPSLGIGRNGALPWPMLKKEMAYFSRVTKRKPTPAHPENVVIMGRKTWESIPPKFRPLPSRKNVVVSRSGNVEGDAMVVKSIEHAAQVAEDMQRSSGAEQSASAKLFVIGGAALYDAALKLPQTKYVLLTKIWKEYECDTIFPVDLDASESWVRRDNSQLSEFVGEDVPEGKVTDGDVDFEFCLYEKV